MTIAPLTYPSQLVELPSRIQEDSQEYSYSYTNALEGETNDRRSGEQDEHLASEPSASHLDGCSIVYTQDSKF